MNWYEQRGILARRPYPPIDLPSTNSQLGGLPQLSTVDQWPRATDGTPLHFLARIDCSELPEARGPLPTSGILQFFARIDEEMIWEGNATDFSRVLYHDEITGAQTLPPGDLPPIEGGWNIFDREMRLPSEPARRTYPRWPLVFESIRTWPKHIPLDPGSGVHWRDYRTAVERAQAAEVVRTTGWSVKAPLERQWGESTFNKTGQSVVVLPDQPFNGEAFPQAWILIDRTSRSMARFAIEEMKKLRAADSRAISDTDRATLTTDFEDILSQALEWVQKASHAGLDEATTESDSKEYIEWLTQLSCDSRFTIRYLVMRSIKLGMSSAIKYCGGSPKAAKTVPVVYMNCLEDEHSLTKVDTSGIKVAPPRRWISTTHHQLLGHASTSQDIGSRTSKDVLLLHLVSDRGVDFMFCDSGEIQFWIDVDDLIARRFDLVRANTQGG